MADHILAPSSYSNVGTPRCGVTVKAMETAGADCTGLERYRNIRVEPTEEAKAQAYSMVGDDSFDYDLGSGSGAAVPLEEFDLSDYR